MDKKNTLLGVLFLLAAVAASWWTIQEQGEQRRQEAERAAAAAAEAETRAGEDSGAASSEGMEGDGLFARPAELAPADDGTVPPLVREATERLSSETVEEQTATLENGYYRATFSTQGAALKTIALIERADERLLYPVESGSDEPVVLHAQAKVRPLTIAQQVNGRFLPLPVSFSLVEQSDDSLIFEATLENGLKLRRSFHSVEGEHDEPANYTIRQEFSVTNPTDAAMQLDELYVNVGTAAPTNADPRGFDLNASYLEGDDYHNITGNKFSGGFFSDAKDRVEGTGNILWGAVKNQFFTSIVTPANPADRVIALPVKYPAPEGSKRQPVGVSAYLGFPGLELAAGATETIAFDYYSGPKDFTRLKQMPLEQEDVMHFGWFVFWFIGVISIVGKGLFSLLSFLHSHIGNWGFAIIIMTLIVRLCLWPLTAKAARSSKRMQELQKPMAELKEKYKDNPQKQQQATLELFKKHKINPLSSCWPVLLQFPIFIAMFNLLRNTADLRFAEFLWISDLSMPDRTIPLGSSLPFIGDAINVLPFVWVASMWFQMKMMPQPSVDNSQTKIIKYMPFIFFPFTYMFSSGLVLYWTTTNCFSIFQGWMTRRSKDAEDIAIEEEIAESEKKKSTLKTTPLGGKKRKKKDGGQGGRR